MHIKLITGIEAVINGFRVTIHSSEINDPAPLTPSYMMYDRSICHFRMRTLLTTSMICVVDVVQIHDESSRSNWKLAVITDVITGRHGRIRAARMRTSDDQWTCTSRRITIP
ncbi:hypothetical protein DPMN_125611 [Dreissena polymorpha]|uniref:DUF5641 domain-containing protein n=1 Tax=Dreissena polymorpha TaxID=45954 RepID=A0A9D4JUV8_DREPO|nr:hypothetical protein DPMN_125611 [Dreissena polymorpha]